MSGYSIDRSSSFDLDTLLNENPSLYTKFIDCLRSGEMQILTNDEIIDLRNRNLVDTNIESKIVIVTLVAELLNRNLHETQEDFLGENGYIENAKKAMPQLVQKLIEALQSGEDLSFREDLQPLERYHLVFRRKSDHKFAAHIIASKILTQEFFENIDDNNQVEG